MDAGARGGGQDKEEGVLLLVRLMPMQRIAKHTLNSVLKIIPMHFTVFPLKVHYITLITLLKSININIAATYNT